MYKKESCQFVFKHEQFIFFLFRKNDNRRLLELKGLLKFVHIISPNFSVRKEKLNNIKWPFQVSD